MKKGILGIMFLAAVIFPAVTQAQSPDVQAQIVQLTQLIKQLQAQLSALQKSSGTSWCHNFNSNLKYGDRGEDVEALTTALVKEGVLSERSSNFSGFYDEVASSGVSGFQLKYKAEILDPNGLSYGTGYTGPSTRAVLNRLYGCGKQVTNPLVPEPQPTTAVITAPRVKLSVSPNEIVSDGKPGTATLSWWSEGADYCIYEKQNLPSIGSLSVGVDHTTTYGISCVGKGGTSYSNQVTVTFALNMVTNIPPPVVNLWSLVSSVVTDGKPVDVRLYWTSTYANSCIFGKETVPAQGSYTVPVSQTSTFTIGCTGAGGTSTSNAVTIPVVTGYAPD